MLLTLIHLLNLFSLQNDRKGWSLGRHPFPLSEASPSRSFSRGLCFLLNRFSLLNSKLFLILLSKLWLKLCTEGRKGRGLAYVTFRSDTSNMKKTTEESTGRVHVWAICVIVLCCWHLLLLCLLHIWIQDMTFQTLSYLFWFSFQMNSGHSSIPTEPFQKKAMTGFKCYKLAKAAHSSL